MNDEFLQTIKHILPLLNWDSILCWQILLQNKQHCFL